MSGFMVTIMIENDNIHIIMGYLQGKGRLVQG